MTTETTTRGESVDDDELVTVLVPARNEERTITACLESILGQDYRNLQVIVVDGVLGRDAPDRRGNGPPGPTRRDDHR